MARRRGVIGSVATACLLTASGTSGQTAAGGCPGATPRDQAQHGWEVQSQGHWTEAERCLQQAALVLDDHWIRHHQRELSASLRTIGEHLGNLEITEGVPGARVVVDGVEVATLPMTQPARVVAAPVTVQVIAQGYHTAERHLTIRAGDLVREAITLAPDVAEPVATPTPAPTPVPRPVPAPVPVTVPVTVARAPTSTPAAEARGFPWRPVGWTGVVIGGVAIALGGVLYGLYQGQVSAYVNNGCGTVLVTPGADCSESTGLTEQAAGIGLLIGGGVVAAAGLVMVLAAPSSNAREQRLSAWFRCGGGPGTVGFACGGVF